MGFVTSGYTRMRGKLMYFTVYILNLSAFTTQQKLLILTAECHSVRYKLQLLGLAIV